MAPPAARPPAADRPAATAAEPPAAPRLHHDPSAGPAARCWRPSPVMPRARRMAARLRGVLLSGNHSLANVDGQMVAIGEKIDGHRLLSVTEYQAVFERTGAASPSTCAVRPGSPDSDPPSPRHRPRGLRPRRHRPAGRLRRRSRATAHHRQSARRAGGRRVRDALATRRSTCW